MKTVRSQIRSLATLAMVLLWLTLVVFSIRSFWRSDRIALESFDRNVPRALTDARFFHSYSFLSSHGGFGLAIHFQILFTKQAGRHIAWETSDHPGYPFFAPIRILGGYSSGHPFRQSGRVYSTNLFPESLTASEPPTAGEWSLHYGGFHASVTGDSGTDRAWLIILPCWSLIAGWGLITAFLLRQQIGIFRSRQRMQMGICRICGYDLRATPQRCPECGTIPPAAKGAAT